ncbi:hypothetical protein PENSPDRAFT_690105 [Peniophora sp. CONT]|nr:hypothetical protein PENSPDRAFT_690105 [Peniophora sp. CONT]
MPPTVEAFVDLLTDVVKAKRLSSSKVQELTDMGMRLMKSDTLLVSALSRAQSSATGAHAVHVLYVVDSLARTARRYSNKRALSADEGGNAASFMENLAALVPLLYTGVLAPGVPEGKEKAKKILDIWRKDHTFAPDVLAGLGSQLQEARAREKDEGAYLILNLPTLYHLRITLDEHKTIICTISASSYLTDKTKAPTPPHAAPTPPVASSSTPPVLPSADPAATLLNLLNQAKSLNQANALIGAPAVAAALPPSALNGLDETQRRLFQHLAQTAVNASTPTPPPPINTTSVDPRRARDPRLASAISPTTNGGTPYMNGSVATADPRRPSQAQGSDPRTRDPRAREHEPPLRSSVPRDERSRSPPPRGQAPSRIEGRRESPMPHHAVPVPEDTNGDVNGNVKEAAATVTLTTFDWPSFDPTSSACWTALAKAWEATHGYVPMQEELMILLNVGAGVPMPIGPMMGGMGMGMGSDFGMGAGVGAFGAGAGTSAFGAGTGPAFGADTGMQNGFGAGAGAGMNGGFGAGAASNGPRSKETDAVALGPPDAVPAENAVAARGKMTRVGDKWVFQPHAQA